MAEIEIRDLKNNVTGRMGLPDEISGGGRRMPLLHEAVRNFLSNQRQGTHATKSRGLVRGGGKKPWRQKHTGRSRAGSIRSPLWRGGGTTFGPRPRDYTYRMPGQAKKQALYAALSEKIKAGEVLVIEDLKMDEAKTRKMVEIMDALGLKDKSLLIVDGEPNRALYLSSRNIPAVRCKAAKDVNAYDVLSHGRVMISRAAMEALKAK